MKLASAVKLGIPEQKAEELWSTLSKGSPTPVSKFELSNVLYYLGAMIVIVAMGWIAGIAWERLSGKGLFLMALLYIAAFVGVGSVLWKRNYKVPGDLFITICSRRNCFRRV